MTGRHVQHDDRRSDEVVGDAEEAGLEVVSRPGEGVTVASAFARFLRAAPDLDELEIERSPDPARRVQP